ncbi:MAG: cobalt-precorrin-5B (C(1))-methyltransferase CbiD [Candidatus Jettenia sp.]|nr:MAG: cobalt-precorrin-5B (C(1))-methyltransferase CbiD [Candidatus Jettenia sp.]
MSLRSGYTTGSCATAAAKAAAIGLLKGDIPDEVEIDTPIGVKLTLRIFNKRLSDTASECAVQKDAGDDPDVTNGCRIYARVEWNNTDTIEIDGGEGVGRVTKPGLQVAVGKAAINPVPRRMIEDAVRKVIGSGVGVKVIISVPEGKTLGEKTFNPRLGITGGISIIGTTGIVRPMSEESFKTSLLCGLDIARGIGYETVVLVPGSLGERSILNRVDIPKDQVIQISNFVGFMLEEAQKRLFKKIILAGHPGKLAKLLRGNFHTHSAVSKPANDILIDTIQRTPLPDRVIEGLKDVSTVEGIVELLRDNSLSVMDKVADEIEGKIRAFYKDRQPFAAPEAGVILFDMKGSVIGISKSAQTWLEIIKTKSLSSVVDQG